MHAPFAARKVERGLDPSVHARPNFGRQGPWHEGVVHHVRKAEVGGGLVAHQSGIQVHAAAFGHLEMQILDLHRQGFAGGEAQRQAKVFCPGSPVAHVEPSHLACDRDPCEGLRQGEFHGGFGT
ncbi:MAG: hypothetical protein KA712_22540 [Myxococcales bacterium]|nr:hypothetical protein [Myxococcales bacterium]